MNKCDLLKVSCVWNFHNKKCLQFNIFWNLKKRLVMKMLESFLLLKTVQLLLDKLIVTNHISNHIIKDY